MPTAKEQSQELVQQRQALKLPLIQEREALSAELDAAVNGTQEQERDVRARIRDCQERTAPIDRLLSTANGVKDLKDDDIRATVVEQIQGKIAALSA